MGGLTKGAWWNYPELSFSLRQRAAKGGQWEENGYCDNGNFRCYISFWLHWVHLVKLSVMKCKFWCHRCDQVWGNGGRMLWQWTLVLLHLILVTFVIFSCIGDEMQVLMPQMSLSVRQQGRMLWQWTLVLTATKCCSTASGFHPYIENAV